jgi:hypothetical protein
MKQAYDQKKSNQTRSHLKKRILVQGRGGREVQTGGILLYFEDLNRAPNKEIGPKDFFEIASNHAVCKQHQTGLKNRYSKRLKFDR